MSADDSHSEVVDATKPQHEQSIPWSELQDSANRKFHASRKYQKNSYEKKLKRKLQDNLSKQYDDLVSDIQRLRLHNKNPDKQVKNLEKLKKKQKKQLKRIAQIQMGSETKSYGCALLDGLNAMIEYMETLGEVVGRETIIFLTDLFTTLYNVYQNPNWKSMTLNFASFFTRHFPKDYANYALCWLKAAFEVACTQDDSTSFKTILLSLFDCAGDFMNDQLWSNINDFFVKIAALYASLEDAVSFEAIDLDSIMKQFELFKKTMPAAKGVIEMAFQAWEFVLGNWENIRTGDWSKLLLGKDETQEFELEVRLIEQAFPLVVARKEIELKETCKMTFKQFETRLAKAIKVAKALMSRCTSVQQKMSVSNFIKTLTEKQGQLYAMLSDAPTKPEAYSVKFAGPSGSGKSTLLNLVSKIILNAYGYDPNERGQVVMTNISESYESTVFPHHKIISADDVANNKNEKPNYDRILNYVNTVPRPLEKAGVAEKGCLYPGNCGFLATTNDETLRAMQCSSCPESILRRFSIDVTVEIKEEFQNAYGGLIKTNGNRFDVYNLTLKRFSHIETDEETGESTIIWDIINRSEWNPNDNGNNDFAAMCKFLTLDVRRHIRDCRAKEKAQAELDNCQFCCKCLCPTVVCECDLTPEEELTDSDLEALLVEDTPAPTSDENTLPSETTPIVSDDVPPPLEDSPLDDDDSDDEDDEKPYVFEKFSPWDDDSDDEDETSEPAVVQASFGSIWSSFSTSELWDLRAALSGSSEAMKSMYRQGALYAKFWRYRREMRNIALRSIGALFLGAILSPKICQPILFSQLGYGVILYQRMIDQVEEELNTRVDRLSSLCVGVREHLRQNIKKYFACGSAIIALYQGYKIIRPFLNVQDKTSFFEDANNIFRDVIKSPKGQQHRFIIQDERDYKEGYSRTTPKETAKGKTSTSSDLLKLLHKSLRVVVVKSKGEFYGTVNGIMVASNVIMVPSHVIPDSRPFSMETTTTPGVPSASTKESRLTDEYCYIDREHDVAFVHLPTCPASRDLSPFFPEEYPKFRTRATTLIWKSPHNEVLKSEQPAREMPSDINYYGNVEKDGFLYGTRSSLETYTLKKGTGLKVDLEFNGFGGLCGGLYVDGSQGIIYGFHVAGFPETKTGFLTCITQSMISKGINQIRSTSPSLVVHSAGDVDIALYDTPFSLDNRPPTYCRPDGTGDNTIVTYFGKVLKDGQELESRARPPYIPTPFKGVVENLGERKHRPPKNPNDIEKGMTTLNKLTTPVQHYDCDLLLKAAADYKEHTLKCIRDNKDELKDVLRVYSQEEAMDGIGEFGLGGLPNATSAGHPINKSKKDCLVRDPMNEAEVKVPREFNEKFPIQKEIDRTIDCWKDGTRSEAIYKASSKVNELLPEEKARKKVRKFYGSGFANFVASRRMLAGVPRFMRKFWRETECLVGINPTSREWDDFHKHLADFSETNCLAGDFAGFDTRMSAQITGIASEIILSWYKEAGCSEEDLTMIAGCLSDIINPNIIFNSDLYRFANGNPSGNLITVQLNSICNSLMMRYVYYAMMPKAEPFAKNVRLGTYGDDNAMAVQPHCRWFNHTACQLEFEKLDISYTMADKDAKSVAYIPLSEVSFLKRLFVQHETLGITVAPIEEDSIMKKFHWIKKPNETPLSPEEQFGAYTDGSFREMYLKGRKAYEDFLKKIQNIVDLNPELKRQVSFIPYDEMTVLLAPDYKADYVNDNKRLFAESMGIDSESMIFDITDNNEEQEEDLKDDLNVISQYLEAQKAKREKPSPFLFLCKVALTSTILGVASNEVHRWWFERNGRLRVARKLASYIRKAKNYGYGKVNTFQEIRGAYDLNGAPGIAEEFGIPLQMAQALSIAVRLVGT